jgi:pteridine reductase
MTPARVALVTGSGKRRVGWYVADALARRGHALVIHYRSSSAEAEKTAAHFRTQGNPVLALEANLTDEHAVRTMFRTTLDQFGRIDVLVNCAAIWRPKPLEAVTAQDVRDHFDTNVLATFLCAQQAVLAMVAQAEGGCIVNMCDWAEVRPYTGYVAYFASKGSIPTLTRSLAVELGGRNPRVRVNCIQPGPVLLPPEMSEETRRRVIAATLVKREGRPENIAQAVLFFLDNDFVTGVSLPVDGGRSIYAPDSG